MSKTRLVHVKFDGYVEINMPDCLPDADADILAGKMAGSKILAIMTDGPSGPVCEEYLHEGSVHACSLDWDESTNNGVTGEWTTHRVEPLVPSKETDQGWHEDLGDCPSVEERYPDDQNPESN